MSDAEQQLVDLAAQTAFEEESLKDKVLFGDNGFSVVAPVKLDLPLNGSISSVVLNVGHYSVSVICQDLFEHDAKRVNVPNPLNLSGVSDLPIKDGSIQLMVVFNYLELSLKSSRKLKLLQNSLQLLRRLLLDLALV